jgi:hypothetical protein
MKAPRKPWEKDLPEGAIGQGSVFGNVVDKEFPPLPEEQNGARRDSNTSGQ